MTRRVGLALVAFLVGSSTVSYAQSLGDVAQREAERRSHASGGRVYTNADLGAPDERTSPPQPEASPVAPQASEPKKTPDASAPAPKDATATADAKELPIPNKRDERYWRTRAGNAHSRLAKATADIAATQARLRALEMEPSTPATAREHEVIERALAKLQVELSSANDDVARMETAAKNDKVPADWIR